MHVYLKPNVLKIAVVTFNHNPVGVSTSMSAFSHLLKSLVPSLTTQHKGKSLQFVFLYNSVFSSLRAFFMLSYTDVGKGRTVNMSPETIPKAGINLQTSLV
jgi:hypothetical protein